MTISYAQSSNLTSEALLLQGIQLLDAGMHNEAILTLQRIPADDSDYSNPTNNIGRAFFAMGQFQEGLTVPFWAR